MKASKQVTKPLLTFTTKQSTIELWVLDVGQYAHLSEHRSFQFYADKSASLIYVQKDMNSFHATEHHINDENTWKWIAEWMTKGMKSEQLLK